MGGGRRRSVKCQSCQAISVFDPTRVAQRCEFCGSSAIIPFEQMKAPIRPESLLEFKEAETQARDKVRSWYGGRWWAPNALKTRALTDTVHGIYIPYWTFDAQVHADWTADAGYYYYETESYTDAQGRRSTRQVRKVRWVPASGSLDHFFDDELVPASKGVQAELLRKVEPFPTTTDLKPYNPGFLSGWVVEQYQIDLVAAAQHSREIMDGKTRDLCVARSAWRYASQSGRGDELLKADVQAHPRADLAAHLHLRPAKFTRWSSTATPAPSPENIRSAGSRSRSRSSPR